MPIRSEAEIISIMPKVASSTSTGYSFESILLRRRNLPLIAKVTPAPKSAATFISRANVSVIKAPLNAVTEPLPDFQITNAATTARLAIAPPRMVVGEADLINTPSINKTIASIAKVISGRAAAAPSCSSTLMFVTATQLLRHRPWWPTQHARISEVPQPEPQRGSRVAMDKGRRIESMR